MNDKEKIDKISHVVNDLMRTGLQRRLCFATIKKIKEILES